ncbi:MAG TPA: alpha/beta hydrolase [Candidatus Limnocylindria bacterium]|nr:alpha/beta hydrolase [Candidatus Limnocylindria bacterium]
MQRRELTFTSHGCRLAGTLALPDGDGPWPAIVTLHPSSTGRRDFRFFLHLEALLVAAGFAVLRYDRRGSGASEGDFAAADLADLADDALAAVELLAATREIDAGLIGFYGVSQGGWIGPEAASRSTRVRFMVLVGACAVTPAEQMRYATATSLRGAGYDEGIVERALAARAAVDAATRGELDRAAAAASVAAIEHEPWFEAAFIPSLPDPDAGVTNKWRLEMDYDIGPALAQLAVPVLLIHGEHDRWTPIEASRQVWRDAFREHPRQLTAVQLPGTGHYPTLARGVEGEEAAPISPDYEALLLRWLRQLAPTV